MLFRSRAYFACPMTFSGLLISYVVGRMAVYTSDQVMVQRFQTTRSLADSRRAFVINAAGDAIWMVGLSFVGLALFAYFQRHALPPGVAFDANSDRIFPFFMSQVFPVGVTGLVIAAIFAASLSSIDSAINSCTSVVVIDFYTRLVKGRRDAGAASGPEERKAELRFSRAATLVLGATGTSLALAVGSLGDLIRISNNIIQTLTGPLAGIFLLGMFSARAGAAGALAGGVAGTATSLFLAFAGDVGALKSYAIDVGFLWPPVFGLAATLAVGWTLSLLLPGPAAGREFTWRAVMSRGVNAAQQND